RADRGVAWRHQHLEGLAQKIVEQGFDSSPSVLAGAVIGIGDIDRTGPAELARRGFIAVLSRLLAVGVVVARDQVGRREGHKERVFALWADPPADGFARSLRRDPDRRVRVLVWPRPEVDIA